MRALEHQMTLINLRHLLLGKLAPRKEDDAIRPVLVNRINDPLRQPLPALAAMAIGRVRAHRQARIQHQHAPVRPGRQQPALLRRRLEVREVVAQALVDVLERGRRGRRRPHGEA